MAERQWTQQQKAAIEHRKGTLLVSAAAGSGKTAVLVERALRTVVEDEVEIDRLLIVTFTNAAVAELKARLSDGLEELLKTAQGEQRQWLRKQKVLLQRANICTADAFCLELVRQNFFRLDIPADISVGDFGQLSSLRSQALEQVQEEFAENEYFSAFSGMYGKAKDDRSAGQILLELYSFFSTQPDKALLRKRMLEQWNNQGGMEQTVWGAGLLQEAEKCLNRLQSLWNEWQTLSMPNMEKLSQSSWQKFDQSLQSELQLLVGASQNGWDAIKKAAEGFSMPSLRPALPADSPHAVLREQMKETVKDICELLPVLEQHDQQDRKIVLPVLEAVLQAEERFEEIFFQLKTERKLLEFSDIEQLALQLLWDSEEQQPTEFAHETAARFHTVMVDEYQDTNALQGRLYECVASAAQDNLFLVGDVKQSIYRFRHAAPEIFQQKRRTFAPFDGQTFPAALALNANFRSVGGVLDGVNDFFEHLMSLPLGEVDYNQDESLKCGLEQAGVPMPPSAPIEIDIVEKTSEHADRDAWQVARRIQTMVQQQVQVRSKDGTRPVEYGDFCILLRTKGGFESYSKALSALGIPSCVDVGSDLLQAPEVQPIASFLQALHHPGNDVQLAAVLTGPIAGFGMDLLVQLRLVQKRGNLYSTLLAWQKAYLNKAEEALAVPPETAGRLCEFLQLFHWLQQQSRTMEGGKLCELLVQKTDWAQAIGAAPLGAQRRQRLEEFLNWTQQAGKNGLSAMVRMLEDAKESGEGIPQPPVGTVEGCVSIMTIHRSKGLEFPVVILADSFHRFNTGDLNKPLLIHPHEGCAMQLSGVSGNYDTAAIVWMKKVLCREMLSEEMRVLYVALTRAKDILCISGAVDTQKLYQSLEKNCYQPISIEVLEQKRTFGDWMMEVILRHPDAEFLRSKVSQTPSRIPLLSNCKSRLNIQFCDGAAQEAEQLQEQQTEHDDALWQQLQAQFAWKDPLKDLTQIESKVSVSQIAHQTQEFGWQPARPAFADTKHNATGAQRGSAAHRFLQLAQLAAFEQNPEQAFDAECKRMVQQNLMDAQAAEMVDKQRILKFFKSELYQRMLRAMQPPARLLREFAFITSIPASVVAKQKGEFGDAGVLLQGVADAVLVFEDHAELVDYKTDFVADATELKHRYALQLQYYKNAIEKRLPVPITKCSIYSLHFGLEIDV